jgi:hypothetical protein
VNLHDWIDELCDALDIDDEIDEALILDLAKTVAHRVARPAAPVSAYLLGLAVGRSAAGADDTERLAAVVQALAEGWEGAPAEEPDDVPVVEAASLDLDFGEDDTEVDLD